MFWKKKKEKRKIDKKPKHAKDNKLSTMRSLIQNQKLAQVKLAQVKDQKQQHQEIRAYNDSAFIEHRTKTLLNALSETSNRNLISTFKEQISDIEFLVFNGTDYAFENNCAILDKIINFAEKSKSLLDERYTEDVWKILADLYDLKSMITNPNIFKTYQMENKRNEIIEYTNKHLN